MTNSPTANFQEVVQALLNEDQLFSMREKRATSRQSFVRQVSIVYCSQPTQRRTGFTRDLSDSGIGLIHKFPVQTGDKAFVTIHRLWDAPIVLKCEACWSSPEQQGWHTSGWSILSVESDLG